VKEESFFSSLQAITAGFFYHTARLSKGGVYKSVKHQQVRERETGVTLLSNIAAIP
jgi:hypothetical protein